MQRYTFSWAGGQYVVYDERHAIARCLDIHDATLVAEALNDRVRAAAVLAKEATQKLRGEVP